VLVKHREPVVQRYLFWATYYGGDPRPSGGRAVHYDIAGYANGSYLRHEGDHLGTLLRYDREATGLRVGAYLDRRAGVWRTDERPVRDVHRGSDCGSPITIAQAGEIIVQLGYGPGLLTADVVDV
jgi:hypothetical protein